MATTTTQPPTSTIQPPTVEAPSYQPGLASASSYQATPYKVEPQGLVQHHLKNIIEDDSPLMQQAARIATQKANTRGLVNSSMAVGDAQQAVIGQALPIAQADAATYDRAMTNTANQQNAASQFNTNAENQVALANQAATNEALKSTQQGTIALTDRQMSTAANLELAKLDSQTKMALTSMDTRTKSLLQSNQSASNAYVQTVQNINQIQNNNQLNSTAKQKAIENQLALLQEQLKQISAQDKTMAQAVQYPEEITSLNLGNFFDPDFTLPNTKPQGQAAYDAAVAAWKDAEAAHRQQYGIPIPTSAYREDYRPPRPSDFGLTATTSPPAGTAGRVVTNPIPPIWQPTVKPTTYTPPWTR